MFGGKPKRSMAKLLGSDFWKKTFKDGKPTREEYDTISKLTPENYKFCRKIVNYKEWYR